MLKRSFTGSGFPCSWVRFVAGAALLVALLVFANERASGQAGTGGATDFNAPTGAGAGFGRAGLGGNVFEGGLGEGDAGFGAGLPGFGGGSAQEIEVSGRFVIDEGRQGYLFVTAKIQDPWYLFSLTQPANGGGQKTTVALEKTGAFQRTGPWRADRPPKIKPEETIPAEGDLPPYVRPLQEVYLDKVTFVAPIEVAEGTDPRSLAIRGEVDGQICSTSCKPLGFMDTSFQARLVEGEARAALIQFAAQTVAAAPPSIASDSEPQLAEATPPEPLDAATWATLIGLGLMGGLLLNLMPCVLPVMGLKMMSFVEQGGQSRQRILAINLAFTAGILVVFLLLATLVVVIGLSWGEQFTQTWFKVALTGFVFAMALSFLGVWEIPIPGFAGGGAAHELSRKEGLTGAFFKGVFSTILATPCSGPLLGGIFGFLLGKPAHVPYVLFASIGIGMALPYLLIAAFPALIRFLPKPGAWMETFKQVMGFVLLLAVVYLFYTLNEAYEVATFALLIGLWFALWLVGRTPITASPAKKAAAWVGGLGVAAAIGVWSFIYTVPGMQDYLWPNRETIAWEDYSEPKLQDLLSKNQTVMLDFTADWCPTCKYNLHFVLDTETVREVIEKNRVRPLVADWTDYAPEIKAKLLEFRSNSIPLLVIFPADNPDEPMILRDVVTQNQVVAALEKAGPSQPLPGGEPATTGVAARSSPLPPGNR